MSAGLRGEVGATATLVGRIAAGDRRAESEFVETYRRGVLALVRRHCRPLEPAVDDLAQEVLIAVLEKLRIGALHEPAALPGYVRSTVVLTVQAEYRKRARRGDFVGDPGTGAAEPEMPDGAADNEPSVQLQRQQLATRVRQLLSEMEVARDHEVLRRFYLLEQDRDAICAALGIDESHFRRVLFRARERFGALARHEGLEVAR
jgi:RNA polymerase sigma-70 factor, ECF subfamily